MAPAWAAMDGEDDAPSCLAAARLPGQVFACSNESRFDLVCCEGRLSTSLRRWREQK